MEASMQHRPQERTFGMVMREVDKDLALFLEMRNRENEKSDLFLNEKVDRVDDLTEIKCDEFLTNGIEDESDFNWLLSGRDTPRCVPLDVEKTANINRISSEDSAPLKSKSKQPAKPANIKPSADRNKRPTSSGGRSVPSRPATPTARPSLPVMSKPSRSSTPTSRGTGPSSKTVAPAVRSSTPTRVIPRSSTPPTRSYVPSSSKSVSRSATPTSIARSSSRSATPTYKSNSTLPASSGQSSKVPSRGASPTVKSRPSKQSEMPSTSVTKRPNSASRVRPTASNSCTLMEASSTGNFRQQSSSPSRARSSNMNSRSTGPAMLSKSYNYGSGGDDDVNPVLIGTQMVERVVNMRKLAPPKQAEPLFDVASSKKSSNSQGNSGFGRSLSKKSLDMAIRHMDLTRSVAGDIRLSKVNTSASSFNVRNGPALSKTSTVAKSELPTRNNALSVPPDFQQGQ